MSRATQTVCSIKWRRLNDFPHNLSLDYVQPAAARRLFGVPGGNGLSRAH